MDSGYARISTGEQTLDLQLDALAQAGCGKVFTETASGAKSERPLPVWGRRCLVTGHRSEMEAVGNWGFKD